MARNIESGPVQEEPEQEINLDPAQENNDTKREPTLREKIVEMEKLLNESLESDESKFKHHEMRRGFSFSFDASEKTRHFDKLLEKLRDQEKAEVETEKLKTEVEMKKAKADLDNLYNGDK